MEIARNSAKPIFSGGTKIGTNSLDLARVLISHDIGLEVTSQSRFPTPAIEYHGAIC